MTTSEPLRADLPMVRGRGATPPPYWPSAHRREPLESPPVEALEIFTRGQVFQVRLATTREEFEQAFQLLADKYQARGYEEPSSKLFRFTPYHALPDTATWVAKRSDRVVATMSLVPDTSFLGLPMDRIFKAEVESLRQQGRRLAEATSLAVRDLDSRAFLQVFLGLKRLMFQHHLRQGGDSWVITVNPRHRNYYRRVLGFLSLGSRRAYPAVGNHPAEAFLIDVETMRGNAPEMYHRIFGEPLPVSLLDHPSRPAHHVHHFADQSTQARKRTILEIAEGVDQFGGRPPWRKSMNRNGRATPLVTKPRGRLACTL